MPANDPKQYDSKYVAEENEYLPWPSDTNDKPFMTYDKLMAGAPGQPAKQGPLDNTRHPEVLTLSRLETD